ncbi:GH22557 [Drosophila grimshawi]|uniref:GH22557 n=1 Tax=Drosophila grimshawi TaxID=7222 RepID=B4K0J2_DROGR|nr:GH22557 [Drosophila grimshawi]
MTACVSAESDGVITVKAPAFGDNCKSTLIDMGIVPVGIVFDDDADLVKLELKAERLQEQYEEDLKCEQHSVKTFTHLPSGEIRQMHCITVDRERERRVPDHHQVDADSAMRSAKNYEYYKVLHQIVGNLETCAQMRKVKYMTNGQGEVQALHQRKARIEDYKNAQAEREATMQALFAQQKIDAEREQERLAKLAEAKAEAAEAEACKQLANAASNKATTDGTAAPTDDICGVDLHSSEAKSRRSRNRSHGAGNAAHGSRCRCSIVDHQQWQH